MNLLQYRASTLERHRIQRLMELIPSGGDTALDVGARDGHISMRLAAFFHTVTALDIRPHLGRAPAVRFVAGDACALSFPDRTFDLVLCTELLEHLPARSLPVACAEIVRVAKRFVIIGVPYLQDLRVGRTVCNACGKVNPPWGHVNTFDESRLRALFAPLRCERVQLVGTTRSRTNALATLLMDIGGNPYGTYEQDETCIYCQASLTPPPAARSILQRAASRLAILANQCQSHFVLESPNWIHVLFARSHVKLPARDKAPLT